MMLGLIIGLILGSAAVVAACGPWKLTIEESVYHKGNSVMVTCSAWISGEYLATKKTCEISPF